MDYVQSIMLLLCFDFYLSHLILFNSRVLLPGAPVIPKRERVSFFLFDIYLSRMNCGIMTNNSLSRYHVV